MRSVSCASEVPPTLDLQHRKSARDGSARLGGGLRGVTRRERDVRPEHAFGAAEKLEQGRISVPRERVEQSGFERAQRARRCEQPARVLGRLSPGLELETEQLGAGERQGALGVGARLAVHGRERRRLSQADGAVFGAELEHQVFRDVLGPGGDAEGLVQGDVEALPGEVRDAGQASDGTPGPARAKLSRMARPLGVLVTGEPVENVRRTRGSFAEMIRETLGGAWDGPFALLDAEKGERPRVGELAGLVVTGSPASVTSRDAWILDAEESLRAFVASGAPTLGICFGHQLLAQALGGNVVKNPRGREIGTVELEVVEADALFGEAPRRLRVNMSHMDTAERLPDGARVLGRTRLDSNGAVRFGERAWGVQFHPEFDGGIVRGYIEARRELIANEGIDLESLLSEDAPESAELLRRFARLVATE